MAPEARALRMRYRPANIVLVSSGEKLLPFATAGVRAAIWEGLGVAGTRRIPQTPQKLPAPARAPHEGQRTLFKVWASLIWFPTALPRLNWIRALTQSEAHFHDGTISAGSCVDVARSSWLGCRFRLRHCRRTARAR